MSRKRHGKSKSKSKSNNQCKSSRRKSSNSRPVSEWAGGRFNSPFYVTEGEPYRPEMVVWMELPSKMVVTVNVSDPKSPVSFSDVLLEAMSSPLPEAAQLPARIRVADAELAAEIRAAHPDLEVIVAPTPELEQLVERMMESMPGDSQGASYFEEGRVSAEVVEDLFIAADDLFGIAPWKATDDSQVIRLDIPEYGIEGACVSIIGMLGESLGFIIFPSIDAYERFVEFAHNKTPDSGPIDLGGTNLSLNYERGADLPPVMRREVSTNTWPVAAANAYPWIQHRERDGVPRPLAELDVRIVSACAGALSAMFSKHRQLFETNDFKPICESYCNDSELEVRLTVPYETGRLFAVNDHPPEVPSEVGTEAVGRNEPCPCGSGSKYKKCCLRNREALRTLANTAMSAHAMDQKLVQEMMAFARSRFGEGWWERASEDFDDHNESMQLFVPWLVYCVAIDGKPVAHWFLDSHKKDISAAEGAWLEAQQACWMSAWEVTSVEPGRSLNLRDLLSGEERMILEASGSKTLVVHDVLLARVIDYDGMSLLAGNYPRSLSPLRAAEVVGKLRGRLRRKRLVPVERLRDEKNGRYAIARWEDAVYEIDDRRPVLPPMQETLLDELSDYDPSAMPQEASQLLQEYQAKHYSDWAEQPLPALKGKTPKEASKTKAGRDEVDLLLKDFENGAARMPLEQRFDFSSIREELGLLSR